MVFGRIVQGMRVFKLIDKGEVVNERPVKVAKIVSAGDYNMFTKELKEQVESQKSGMSSAASKVRGVKA